MWTSTFTLTLVSLVLRQRPNVVIMSNELLFLVRNLTSFTQTLDVRSFNTRIAELVRNGLIEDAQKLFDENPRRNTVSCNTMIRGYFKNHEFSRAVQMFECMPERDLFSYNTMIAGLMGSGDVHRARNVFEEMPVRDVVSWNSMLAGFVRNYFIDEAIAFYNSMPERNVISSNLVMGGLVNVGSFELAERIFLEMTDRDIASWTIMITALSGVCRIDEARGLFERMPERDVQAWNAMLACYARNDRIEDAETLFMKMPLRDKNSWKELISGEVGHHCFRKAMELFMDMPQKDTSSWNSFLLGLIRSDYVELAHALFEKTPFKDIISWTNLMVGYFRSRNVDAALEFFRSMPCSDGAAWNAAIYGLGENDNGEEGLRLFLEMKVKEGLVPDEATFTSVLNICSTLPSLDFGRQAHGHVRKLGFDRFPAVGNALITMYARSGSIGSAYMTFCHMPILDTISWNSMISGFSYHGKVTEALDLFRSMRMANAQPNHSTFIGILSACSHSGRIKEGQFYFELMVYKYFLKPTSEHCTCIVDLFGRFGFINEAVELMERMRFHGIEASGSEWCSLLGACRMHRNMEVGEVAGWKVLEMEPWNAGAYLILGEMYISFGRRRDAERVWELMQERGVKKEPGCSWIDVNNCVHVFLAGDSSHPRSTISVACWIHWNLVALCEGQ